MENNRRNAYTCMLVKLEVLMGSKHPFLVLFLA